MTRRSKQGSVQSTMTYHERSQLDHGTARQRLPKAALRKFNDCFMCLQMARDPMCCLEGHLGCKECYFESILQQKKDLERRHEEEEMQEKRLQLEAEEQRWKEEQARIEKFEQRETKIATESVEKQKQTLNSIFWLPSSQPEAKRDEEKGKREVLCLAEDAGHPVAAKKLISVKWKVVKDTKNEIGKQDTLYACPSCEKAFTDGSKLIILARCGHVYCKDCTKFVSGEKANCLVCDAKVKPKDLIQLQSSEGTGFASIGKSMAEKKTIAHH